MADLIVSYYIESPVATPHGQRIWDDGKVENFRTSKYVKGSDGKYHDEPVVPDWYEVAILSQSQVDAVRQAVADSNLDQLPLRLAASGKSSDLYPEAATWQFMSEDDGQKTVEIEDWSPVGPTQGPLLQLVQRLGEIVSVAQSGSTTAP
jgi:hypothetical protein